MVVIVVVAFVGHWEEGCFGGIDGFAPKFEMPVSEGAVVFVHFGVFDDYGPSTNSRLAPVGR